MTPENAQYKAAFFTLGCKLNYAETSTIGQQLLSRGFRRASKDEAPDLCVVNTCSVTETADKKARTLIRHLASKWPDASIVVTGCYAQLKPDEVSALPGVDIVLGNDEKLHIAQYLDRWQETHAPLSEITPPLEIRRFMPSCERGDRTRWWLKVQDGCDYFCTYCTIPYARGRSRSGVIADLVDRARKAADEGAKEIVITGVNIGEFGSDNGQSFFDLIRGLDTVPGIERYRISSIEPNLLTDDIIDWVAQSRAFMPHFHIPLQSGSDRVLKLMNRRYATSLFRERVEHIRRVMPHAFIGVDVIAGARGETGQEWAEACRFIESLPVSRLHVFPYSERPGTAALHLPDPVPQAEKHRRVEQLIAISDAKLRQFLDSQHGAERPVLWEHTVHDGMMQGFTDNYVRVQAPFDAGMVNRISTLVLTPDNIVAEQ